MRIVPISLLALIQPLLLPAQSDNPDLQEMVNTERAFVQMAEDQNTRDAFLYYMTDDVITSGPNGMLKGKEEIRKQEVSPGWLYWEIAFSDIASSGDIGYNTGPWEFRSNKTDEKAITFGEFNSIWKKQKDGSWKNALDIGIRHREPLQKVNWSTSSRPTKRLNMKPGVLGDASSLIKKEKEFLSLFEKQGNQAYTSYLSKESRICRTDQLPMITSVEKQKFLNETKLTTQPQIVDGEVASSNDLGYVYGSAIVQTTNNSNQFENKTATYFRVWKKEESEWKIVLDVLTY